MNRRMGRWDFVTRAAIAILSTENVEVTRIQVRGSRRISCRRLPVATVICEFNKGSRLARTDEEYANFSIARPTLPQSPTIASSQQLVKKLPHELHTNCSGCSHERRVSIRRWTQKAYSIMVDPRANRDPGMPANKLAKRVRI